VGRILIVEPHPDVRALLELLVVRLGHEPILHDVRDPSTVEVDAAVIEPGERPGLAVARLLRAGGVPVVFVSIFPAEDDALELEPVAYLVKPFPVYALEQALGAALGSSGLPVRPATAASLA
jgi:CheY-like chemotaxis protein